MTDELNPYRPPVSELDLPLAMRPMAPASNGRRFGTFVVDYVCFMVFAAVVGLAAAALFGAAGTDAIESLPEIVVGSLIMIVYYVFFEALWARTPGKFVFGTVVIDESGAKPSVGQVFGRTLCRFIPFEAFSFFGKRGWHDSIPKTHVVLAKLP